MQLLNKRRLGAAVQGCIGQADGVVHLPCTCGGRAWQGGVEPASMSGVLMASGEERDLATRRAETGRLGEP